MNWQPIETAPRDGRPVWVEGFNYGEEKRGKHCCWAWWSHANEEWLEATSQNVAMLKHLKYWLAPEPPHD